MKSHNEEGTREDVLDMIETATELINVVEQYCEHVIKA